MPALMIALALLAAQDTTVAPPPPEPVTEAPAPAAAPPLPEAAPADAAAAPAAEAKPETEAKAEEAPYPPGAPQDDYGFVAWCYGALAGYLDLHDRVMPEVTRIEGAYRRPGSNLADDLKTYDDMRKASRANMKLFARAIEAAEKASLQPISQRGAAAIQKGRAAWAGASAMSDRTVAQQWMGWALPARCTSTAATLEQRAKLVGATFKANDPAPESSAEPAPEASAEPAPADVAAPPADVAAPPAADGPPDPSATPKQESSPTTQAPVESAPTRP